MVIQRRVVPQGHWGLGGHSGRASKSGARRKLGFSRSLSGWRSWNARVWQRPPYPPNPRETQWTSLCSLSGLWLVTLFGHNAKLLIKPS